ncbi:hypothetical protein EW026_g7640 [Hermanssonia centrifuga]|uniref:Cytochrome P450 n=1 Tax=Hermanssonia centrifuga TaxID=98765 RepID=A0A4S4K774_9APHY|nr:hypothetical protein EW026_g7640 [Hermanssonia centrifuga]
MYSTPSTVVLTLLFLVFLGKILLTLIRARRLRKLMPPGPPGLPLLGNILQIPTKDVWWKFLEWSQEYGPIFSLDFAGKPVVVLNTYETATDLLDRRSGIYADRPDLPMVNNILSGGMNLGFMHYGDLAAGSETTGSSLCFLILAMVLYPDVLRHAQAELDSVIGRGRTPTFEDRPELPYIGAIVKEVFSVINGPSFYRYSSEMYTGTTVFQNLWAISHNPAVFTDPQEFRPERFLNPDDKDQHELSAEDESSSKVRPNPDKLYAFGFGRRICPGMHLANNSLFIAAATLLWACDITNALDEDGNAIIPDMNALFDTGLGM